MSWKSLKAIIVPSRAIEREGRNHPRGMGTENQDESEDLKTKRDFLIVAFVYLAITVVAIAIFQVFLPYPL
jgi:hypothetical protein